jgi:cellobiose PTS system EIIC component
MAYLAFHFDLVARPYLETLWTLPAPVGAFLATGGDWRAIALQFVNLCLGVLVYWPYVRRYDRDLLSRESSTPVKGTHLLTSVPKAGSTEASG